MSYWHYTSPFNTIAPPTDGFDATRSAFGLFGTSTLGQASSDAGQIYNNGNGFDNELGDRPLWTKGWDVATEDPDMWIGGGCSLVIAGFPDSNIRILQP